MRKLWMKRGGQEIPLPGRDDPIRIKLREDLDSRADLGSDRRTDKHGRKWFAVESLDRDRAFKAIDLSAKRIPIHGEIHHP